MSRELTTLQVVSSVEPIDGAEFIELVKFKDVSWQCIVKKSDGIKPGDSIVYFEIDSLVSKVKGLEFMEKNKFRVKTIKLRGVLSQGLAVRPQDLPDLAGVLLSNNQCLDNILKVEKYESPSEKESEKSGGSFGKSSGEFPKLIANVTNEPRCQRLSRQISDLLGIEFYAREKLDGSSMTMIMHPRTPRKALKRLGRFGDWLTSLLIDTRFEKHAFEPQELIVCSRNLIKQRPGVVDKFGKTSEAGHFWRAAIKHNVEEKMRDWVNKNNFDRPLVVQAELIGPSCGSQGDYYNVKEHQLFIFDISYPTPEAKTKVKYIDQKSLDNIVSTIFGDTIKTAPIKWQGKLNMTVDEMLKMAEFKTNIPGLKEVNSEGLVFRPAVEIPYQGAGFENERISFKAISNLFLLKEK